MSAGGPLELDFNSGRDGTVEKTKDHSLKVREQVKTYENIDISEIDYQIEREGLRFWKKKYQLYYDILMVPFTNCDTVERDFEIFHDVSRKTPISIVPNFVGGVSRAGFQ